MQVAPTRIDDYSTIGFLFPSSDDVSRPYLKKKDVLAKIHRRTVDRPVWLITPSGLAAFALWRTQGCVLYIGPLLPLPLFLKFIVLVT